MAPSEHGRIEYFFFSFFLEFEWYFWRSEIYCEKGNGYFDNWERFEFFHQRCVGYVLFSWIGSRISYTRMIGLMVSYWSCWRSNKSADWATQHLYPEHGKSLIRPVWFVLVHWASKMVIQSVCFGGMWRYKYHEGNLWCIQIKLRRDKNFNRRVGLGWCHQLSCCRFVLDM